MNEASPSYDPKIDENILDINKVLEYLPHRYPFLLVDRITLIEDDKRIEGIKNVTINEPFFQGHFPGWPVMPGVLQLEALAQLSGVLLLKNPEDRGSLAFFMAVDKARFRKPVLPGDQLRLIGEVMKIKKRLLKVKGTAMVDGQVVSEAELMFSVFPRP